MHTTSARFECIVLFVIDIVFNNIFSRISNAQLVCTDGSWKRLSPSIGQPDEGNSVARFGRGGEKVVFASGHRNYETPVESGAGESSVRADPGERCVWRGWQKYSGPLRFVRRPRTGNYFKKKKTGLTIDVKRRLRRTVGGGGPEG